MSVNTEFALSYEIDVDINLAGIGEAPNWQGVRFISAVAPNNAPVTVDAATYDDRGAANVVKIGETNTLGFTVQGQRNADGSYLPELQKLVEAGRPSTRGNENVVEIRYYDSEGSDYAYQGFYAVDIQRATTGNAEIGSWAVTLTGKGRLIAIANPATGTPAEADPAVTGATPTAAVAGALVTIKGSGFTGVTGATGVKFGTVNAASYTVVSDGVIVASVPAGTAGAANITITRGSTTSAAYPYTRGA